MYIMYMPEQKRQMESMYMKHQHHCSTLRLHWYQFLISPVILVEVVGVIVHYLVLECDMVLS